MGALPDFGEYRVGELLGRGAMGAVYRATRADGLPVALKVVLRAVMDAEQVIARFCREATVRIDHPNVTQVLDAGTTPDGLPYIAFELLEGESVADWLRRERLGVADVVDLGKQVARGLGAAHARGIVHRDLKPANLFRCRDGTIKILDFGVALAQSQGTRLTSLGSILGTPAYLSPEQASGRQDIDGRADIWALGSLLFEAIAGQPPFERDTPLATIVAVLRDPLPPLSGATGPLAAVITRALAREPAARWASAQELEAALGAIDASDAQAAAGPGRVSSVGLEENRVVAILLAEDVTERERIEAAVADNGGTALALVGERVVGLFGGDAWFGDEGTRAVRAALAARTAAGAMSIASGLARRSDVGITGQVLSRAEAGCAARLAGVAVDLETARALPRAFATRDAGEGLVEVDSGEPSPSSRTTDEDFRVPLVDRRAEVAQLASAVETVLDERRCLVVLLSGAPGLGKTRLRLELQRLVSQSPDFTVIVARAEPRQREVALSLATEVMRSRARACELAIGWPALDVALPLELRQTAIASLAEGAGGGETAPFLGELLGVPMEDSLSLRAARSDGRLMADRLRLACRDVLVGLAERGPLALVLEDLQWADGASIELLEELAEHLAPRPLLVFATARPELARERPDLFAGSDVVRIDLRGLSAADVAALAEGVAGRRPSAELSRALAERTAGNPLFVEQIVLALVDGGGDLEGAGAQLPLPATVEAAVQSRLDGLPAMEKELCKRAAILSRPFNASDLAALGVEEPQALLGPLVRREILTPRSRPDGSRCHTFRSSLVADVAGRMLADELREDLHRAAAVLVAHSSAPDPEEIARHHDLGGQPTQAARHYVDAALIAARRGDAATVLRCSDRALALGPPPGMELELRMCRSDALRFTGRRDEQGEEIRRALAVADTDAGRARALAEHTAWLAGTGCPTDAMAAAEEAATLARRGGDPELLVRVLAVRAFARLFGGDIEGAERSLAEAGAVGGVQSPTTRAFVLEWRAQVAGAMGDAPARLAAFREAAALYREAGDLRRAAGAECNLADAHNRLGAFGAAETGLRVAVADCRRLGNLLMLGYALANLGYALTELGRSAEAAEVLAEASELARVTRDERLAVITVVYAARARLPEDDQALEKAAADAERLRFAPASASAHALAARIRLATGNVAGALERSSRALAIRDESGGLEEGEAEVFLTHAEVLEAAGRREEAAEVRFRGRSRLEELAGSITDAALRRAFLQDVPAHARLLEHPTASSGPRPAPA